MQHFLSLRGSLDERFKEQIAENLPERSFPHFVHALQMQDLASNNQKNGLYTRGDSLLNSSGQVREEYGSSMPISGGFRGSSTRTMISPSKPEALTARGVPTASEMRSPSSGITDMQHDTPLTIFYAGSVNIFNNISAEQAQAIMLLASAGNAQGNPVDDPAAATVAVMSMNSTPSACPQDKSLMNLLSNQAVVNQQGKSNQGNQFSTNMQLDFEHLNIPVPSSLVPSGQPLVPTILPHARKASLARFLEKRRERAQHSKCPYSVRQEDSSLPEERLSSSNDPTSYAHCSDRVDKKKGLILSWMEKVVEYSTSDVVVKEQKITVT